MCVASWLVYQIYLHLYNFPVKLIKLKIKHKSPYKAKSDSHKCTICNYRCIFILFVLTFLYQILVDLRISTNHRYVDKRNRLNKKIVNSDCVRYIIRFVKCRAITPTVYRLTKIREFWEFLR